MKRSEIYHMVSELIQQNKFEATSKDLSNRNFIPNYYRQFLRRNKLLPRNRHYRIKQLMKNFEELDTYVDISELLAAIEAKLIVQAEKGQRKSANICMENRQSIFEKNHTEPIDRKTSCERSLRKAETLLKTEYKDGNFIELNKCKKLVKYLQDNSNEMENYKYRNNCKQTTYHELINKKYYEGKGVQLTTLRNQNAGDGALDLSKRRLSKQESKLHPSPFQMVRSSESAQDYFLRNKATVKKPVKKINQIEHTQLMRTASSYLHVILQREHKKKWALNKKNQTQHISKIEEKGYEEKQNSPPASLNKVISDDDKLRESLVPEQTDLKSRSSLNIPAKYPGRRKKIEKDHMAIAKNKQKIQDTVWKKQSYILNKKSTKQSDSTPIKKQNLCSCIQKRSKESRTYRSKYLINKILTQPIEPGHKSLLATSTSGKKNNPKHLEKFKLMNTFTFRNRRIKEKVLERIDQFVNDMDYVQRKIMVDGRDCEEKLSQLQKNMELQFDKFTEEKLVDEDKALDGVRKILSYPHNQKITLRTRKLTKKPK